MKVKFNVKYGQNEIEIPDTQSFSEEKNKLKNLFSGKVTIYNDITFEGKEKRKFCSHVIDDCFVSLEFKEKSDGTAEHCQRTANIFTKDVKHYKTPDEYRRLPEEKRGDFYTVRTGDFIVLDEITDSVKTSKEFYELLEKYREVGFFVTDWDVNVFGFRCDNLRIGGA